MHFYTQGAIRVLKCMRRRPSRAGTANMQNASQHAGRESFCMPAGWIGCPPRGTRTGYENMAVKDHATRRRRQPSGAVVTAIMLGDRCITPRRWARMATDIEGAYGYPRDGVYRFEHPHRLPEGDDQGA